MTLGPPLAISRDGRKEESGFPELPMNLRVPIRLARTSALVGVACLAVASACWRGDEYVPDYSVTYGSVGDGGLTGDGAPSAMPMLATIDPSATMMQTPGQGVGVFTQYDPGGHWYVWWTCDTSLSGLSCPFTVGVSVATGAISNALTEGFSNTDQLTSAGDGGTSGSLSATATATTQVQGLHFDATPGATITLSAALGGGYSGQFLFFVQNGKVNGGYTGTLTDPLQLEPSSP